MNAAPPPPGWYPDPSRRAPFRYWDGGRWTEHTHDGNTGAAQAPGPAVAQTPSYPPAGQYPPGQQYPSAGPHRPGQYGVQGAPRPAATMTSQGFVEDLKKLEGYAVVVVGTLLFIIASFLPWVSGSLSVAGQGSESDSANGWEGEGYWLIRGYDIDSSDPTQESGTDMVILLPIALIAAGAVVAPKLGKQVPSGPLIGLAGAGLLTALMIAEFVTVKDAFDKIADAGRAQGADVDVGPGFGMYFAIVCAIGMTYGAFRAFQAGQRGS